MTILDQPNSFPNVKFDHSLDSFKLDELISMMLIEHNKMLALIANLGAYLCLVSGSYVENTIMAWFYAIQIITYKRNQEISNFICYQFTAEETRMWINVQIVHALRNLYRQTRSTRNLLWVFCCLIEERNQFKISESN